LKKIISVIIPAYNEELKIQRVLRTLESIDAIKNIFVIDDGSTDKTYRKVLKFKKVHLIKLPKNRGKGEALRIGIKNNIESADIIVFLDADIICDANEISELLIPLESNKVDVTVAKFSSKKAKAGIGLTKQLAKIGLYMTTNMHFGSILSGQRAFKKEVLKNISFISNGFSVELEMLIEILRLQYVVKEVEIPMTHSETGRDLAGFLHRGKQFAHIAHMLVFKYLLKLHKNKEVL